MIRLQILSGPQAGAQESVAVGQWLLGSGDHCDLVIRDPGVREEQLSLRVSNERVSTRTISPVRENDGGHGKTTGVDVDWSAGEILCLANTTLIWQPEVPDETIGIELSGPASAGSGAQSVNHSSRYSRWALGSLAALLVAGILTVQANRAKADAQNASGPPDPSAQAGQLQSIAARLQAGDFTDLAVEQDKAGVPTVVGWVRDRAEHGRLMRNLSGLKVMTSVVEAEEQIRFAHEYLLAREPTANVRYSGNGVFLIEASGSDEAGFRQRVQGLRSAAPLVRRFELEYQQQPLASAAPQAANIGLPAPPRSMISGIDAINLIGRQRFLTSGTHYVFEGGVLPDGSRVEVIEADQITLTPHFRANKENLHVTSRERRN